MAVQAHATAKYVRTSALKAGLVLNLIRGRDVNAALATLRFARKGVARDIEKVLRSAVANAESNPNRHWNGDELYVKAIFVDDGPTIKRWRARARGRVNRIFKRTCHITVKLDQLQQVEIAPPKPKAAAKPKEAAEPKSPAKTRTRKKKAVAS